MIGHLIIRLCEIDAGISSRCFAFLNRDLLFMDRFPSIAGRRRLRDLIMSVGLFFWNLRILFPFIGRGIIPGRDALLLIRHPGCLFIR